MNKEVTMTLRVDRELREQFHSATDLQDRPAAQVLRDFMRAYVHEAQERAATPPKLSAIERFRREEAIAFARASVNLEGFKPSRIAESDARDYAAGAIDVRELAGSRVQLER